MTRAATLSFTAVLALMSLVGCAQAGDATVARATNGDDFVEIIEVHEDGVVDMEIVQRVAGREVVLQHEWSETEAPPPELVAELSEVDRELLEGLTEVTWTESEAAPVPSIWGELVARALGATPDARAGLREGGCPAPKDALCTLIYQPVACGGCAYASPCVAGAAGFEPAECESVAFGL